MNTYVSVTYIQLHIYIYTPLHIIIYNIIYRYTNIHELLCILSRCHKFSAGISTSGTTTPWPLRAWGPNHGRALPVGTSKFTSSSLSGSSGGTDLQDDKKRKISNGKSSMEVYIYIYIAGKITELEIRDFPAMFACQSAKISLKSDLPLRNRQRKQLLMR